MERKIDHIIVLMLENRSFDHIFGFLDHSKMFNGLSGNEYNPRSSKDITKEYVHKGASPFIRYDPGHSFSDVATQLDLGIGGINDGFYYNYNFKYKGKANINPRDVLGSFDPQNPQKYGSILNELARKFVLCDNWFSSVPGETWPNRNFAHSGTSNGDVNNRKKFYRNRTIFEELADNNFTWQIYHDGPAQSWIYYKLWFKKNGGFRQFKHFQKDVSDGKLANYTFIEPRHFNLLSGRTNSMHPGNNLNSSSNDFRASENLCAKIYNTLHSHPEIFKRTLFIITFDEHGGFYDHVKPPACNPPDCKSSKEYNFRFDRYGLRVPAILISPCTRLSEIDSEKYDHTSIIKSVFENFGIKTNLTHRDRNAKSFLHNLDCEKSKGVERIEEFSDFEMESNSEEVQEEYNDLQLQFLEMAKNVKEVMADSKIRVELNILMNNIKEKLVFKSQGFRAQSSVSEIDIEEIENEFIRRYE